MSVISLIPAFPAIICALSIPSGSIGWVIASFSLPGIVMAPVGGVLADRLGRKRILLASLIIFGLAGSACFFSRDFFSLCLLRALQGVGAGPLSVLAGTLIGDLFNDRERVMAMGYNGGVQAMGTAVFPIIGGLLTRIGWNWPFLLSALALPIALAVALFMRNPEPRGRQGFYAYISSVWALMRTRRTLSLLGLSLGTFTLLYGVFVTYLPILLHEHLAGPLEIGAILSIASLATAFAASQLGKLSARFSEITLLRFSFLFYIAAMFLLPCINGIWWTVLPIFCFGLGQGLNLSSLLTLLSGICGMEKRAGVMAVNGFLLRLAQTLAPLFMGLVFSSFGLYAVFIAGVMLAIVLLAVALFVLH